MTYGPAPVTLTGTIEKHVAFGPPGFGENPKTDAREDFTALKLDRPLCTVASGDDDGERDVSVLQMLFFDLKPKLQIGYRATVTGTLMHASTGHHHTKVLIEVKRFE